MLGIRSGATLKVAATLIELVVGRSHSDSLSGWRNGCRAATGAGSALPVARFHGRDQRAGPVGLIRARRPPGYSRGSLFLRTGLIALYQTTLGTRIVKRVTLSDGFPKIA